VLYRDHFSAGLQFGFELGTGMRTFVTATAPYVVGCALLLVVASPPTAFVIGIAFGAGRFLMPLARYFSVSEDIWDEALARSGIWLLPALSVLSALLIGVLALRT
jgi:hypothetical protein